MEYYSTEFSIEAMSKVLQVSRSGYYKWLGRGIPKRRREDQVLFEKIEKIFYEARRVYGSDRIHRVLREQGIRVSRKRVERLMSQNRLYSIYNVKKRVRTTNSEHDNPVSPNLLDRNFEVEQPNQAWVSDITYIPSGAGWLYLCQIKDLFSRKIVGWSLANHMKTELVLEALNMAVESRNPSPGLIFHSDRGVQYCSKIFREALKELGIISSMSRKGNCWDNAPAESFFATLKCELIHHVVLKNLDHARHVIFDYIEFFYNRIRKHSSLGYMSPFKYELKYAS